MRATLWRGAALGTILALALAGCSVADLRGGSIANTPVKAADLANSLRPGLVGVSGYPATGWGQSAITGNPGSPQAIASAIASIGLQSSDVASQLVVKDVPDGTSLGIPTLDFCEGKFASEALRVSRLQRGAYDASGIYSGLSTEVVVYKDAAAAQQALREVTTARVGCPVGKTVKTYDGHTLVFAFHPAPGPSNTPLVPANQRLVIHTTMKVDGSPETTFIVYQIDGRVLAALYAMDSTGKPFTQTTLDAFYGLAGDIARRLQKYAATI